MKITNLEKEEIKIGCCGFPVGKERYYKEFDVVELQSTFYFENAVQFKNLSLAHRED